MSTASAHDQPTIFTIGHSNRQLDDFIKLLQAHDVELLVDVRAFPGSRRQPHFGHEALQESLRRVGIGYTHRRNLGGRRKLDPVHVDEDCCSAWRNASFHAYAQHTQSPAYASALDDLVTTSTTQHVAIVCSEAVPWRCHRWLISDTLVARGVAVLHVLDSGPPRQHQMSAFAVADHANVTWPGPPSQTPLRLGPPESDSAGMP